MDKLGCPGGQTYRQTDRSPINKVSIVSVHPDYCIYGNHAVI